MNKTSKSLYFGAYLLLLFTLVISTCTKDATTSSGNEDNGDDTLPAGETVTDIDGNVYQTVQIGNQLWMAENLKVTRYKNGDAILKVTNDTEWANADSEVGVYCSYGNDDNNIDTYGLLYNWYAVTDERNLAPDGWHVPDASDWRQLEMYLGISDSEVFSNGWRGTDEGAKLKETGTTHWNSPNTGATNSSGFSALPGGYRSYADGTFSSLGNIAAFFTTRAITYQGETTIEGRRLDYMESRIQQDGTRENVGYSVRLVKDSSLLKL